VKSQSKITFLKSFTHDIVSNYSEDSKNCILTLNPLKKEVPNKDFVLLFKNESIHKPQCITTTTKDGFCSLIRYFPEFSTLTTDDAYEAEKANNAKSDEADIFAATGEFIFLLDRSGSMEGSRIK
jgi:hypothetical protein